MGMGTAVDPQGRLAATTELHLGRRTRSRVHLIDLSDGSRQTLPWPTEDEVFMVRAVYDGAVYLNARSSQTTLRWRPGTEPESLPYQVQELDPYSGTAKAYRHDTGFVLLAPDGSTRPLTPEAATARLVPGGTLLCHFDYRPAAVRLVAAADSRPPCTSCRTAPKPPRRYPPDPSGTALTTC